MKLGARPLCGSILWAKAWTAIKAGMCRSEGEHSRHREQSRQAIWGRIQSDLVCWVFPFPFSPPLCLPVSYGTFLISSSEVSLILLSGGRTAALRNLDLAWLLHSLESWVPRSPASSLRGDHIHQGWRGSPCFLGQRRTQGKVMRHCSPGGNEKWWFTPGFESRRRQWEHGV